MRKYIKEKEFCGEMCLYAERTINILRSEIDQLRAEKEALINGQETLQKYIAKLLEENKMKEITTITTIQITKIHKAADESKLKSKEQVEEEVKNVINDIFKPDDINVKHQIFVRDSVENNDRVCPLCGFHGETDTCSICGARMNGGAE